MDLVCRFKGKPPVYRRTRGVAFSEPFIAGVPERDRAPEEENFSFRTGRKNFLIPKPEAKKTLPKPEAKDFSFRNRGKRPRVVIL